MAAAWGLLADLGVAAIIDEEAGARPPGLPLSPGTYLALAALNRVVDPCSKPAFGLVAHHGGGPVHQDPGLGAGSPPVFPVSSLGGPAFVRSVAAPYPDMRFIPTGGINHSTVGAPWSSGPRRSAGMTWSPWARSCCGWTPETAGWPRHGTFPRRKGAASTTSHAA